MPENPTLPDSLVFQGIPKEIAAAWKQIIGANWVDLNKSKNSTELWDKLNELSDSVPGIGYESMRAVVCHILATNDEIDREANCYIGLLTLRIRRKLRHQHVTNSKKLWGWVKENYPSLSKKSKMDKISYLNKNVKTINL